MSGAALGLTLGAAGLHALWNLLLAGAPDPRATMAAALGVAVVAWAPAALLAGGVSAAAWPYVAVSAALEATYFLLLTAAYARGDLSAIYPVARGAAPVLVLLTGLGGSVSVLQALGVVLVGAGVAGVGRVAGLGLALAVAACIAAYTLVDREGLAHADPLPYLWLVLAPAAVVALAVVARERGAAAVRGAFGPAAVVAVLATFGAYGLVLAALERAPAAAVAAVRETSIVLAVALGALVLRERVDRRRW
ncbi:MAG: EamA family transporter, partial [Solirubrobacterales bacterium]|nr:EamA family transporter [Solirubrobacterales bacterium]